MAKSKSRRGSARKVGQSPEIRLVPLPLDVVDHIGGFLEDSPKALGACALTCKLWYAVIRPHIFRRVTVTNRNLNRLKALIRRSPSILFWIRVLRIKGTPYQSRRGLKFRGFDQNETWMYDVLDIFDGEPRKVLSIELLQIEPSGWFHDKLKVFLQKLTTLSFLQSFSLIQCRLPRAVLFGFVRSLPHVTDLHFHNTHCRMPTLASEFPVEELPPSAHPPRLEQLRIHQDTNRGSSDVIDILQIITFTNSYRLLHTLHLHVEDLHTLLVSQAFLRCVGPNLIYLELSLPPLVSRGSRILAYTSESDTLTF